MEKSKPSLKGALPNNYFSRLGLDGSKLSALIDAINNIDTVEDKEEDVVGRVYEYFLGKFAMAEGKGGGRPKSSSWLINRDELDTSSVPGRHNFCTRFNFLCK